MKIVFLFLFAIMVVVMFAIPASAYGTHVESTLYSVDMVCAPEQHNGFACASAKLATIDPLVTECQSVIAIAAKRIGSYRGCYRPKGGGAIRSGVGFTI